MAEETATCYRSVLERGRESAGEPWVLEAAAGLVAASVRLERWDEAREALAAIADPEQDLSLRLGMAFELALEEKCAGASQLLSGVDGATIPKDDVRSMLFMIRARCGEVDGTGATAAELLRSVDPEELRFQVEVLADVLNQAETEQILLERMRSGEVAPALANELLADVRSHGGITDPLSYLEAWADADPANPDPVSRLAYRLEEAGALDLAVEARREAIRRQSSRPSSPAKARSSGRRSATTSTCCATSVDDAAYALGRARDAKGEAAAAAVAYQRSLDLTASYEGQTDATCTCRCEVLDQRAEVKKRLAEVAGANAAAPDPVEVEAGMAQSSLAR